MGINFPAAPIIGELYPTPAIAGIPQYKWDGTAWLAMTPSALTYVQRGGDTMTGHLALPTAPAAANAVRRDFVEAYAAPFDAMAYSGMQINGSMDVSQELGAGTKTGNGFICDGWQQAAVGTAVISGGRAAGGGVVNMQFSNYCYVNTTTAQASMGAGDFVALVHNGEGYRFARLNWGAANAKPITIGFWSAHNPVGTYSGSIRNHDGTRSYVFTYTQNVATVAEYKTVTIPGDTAGTWKTDNGIGLTLTFAMACGATTTAPAANTWYAAQYLAAPGQINGVAAINNAMRISGVVILPGSQAPTAAQSPMIMRPYDQELATCQRYFNKFLGMSVSGFHSSGGSWIFTMYPLVPTMRGLPTLTYADISYNNASALTNSALAPNIAQFRATTTAPGSAAASFTMSYDARL
jgi:hypothetical protein